ncbi:MAG: hypothetical protein RH917_15350 [Lacipirellulaceae bacterium]
MNTLSKTTVPFAVLISLSTICHAATIVRIGIQEFEDGDILTKAEFSASQGIEPRKINTPLGNDLSNQSLSNQRASGWWYLDFDGNYRSASIRMGLWEHDSSAPGHQISFFYINDHDYSDQLNRQLDAHGGGQLEYNIYSVDLPDLTLEELSTGRVHLRLGFGGARANSGNFGGFDFFELHLVEIPETSTLSIATASIASITMRRRYRLKQKYQGR